MKVNKTISILPSEIEYLLKNIRMSYINQERNTFRFRTIGISA